MSPQHCTTTTVSIDEQLMYIYKLQPPTSSTPPSIDYIPTSSPTTLLSNLYTTTSIWTSPPPNTTLAPPQHPVEGNVRNSSCSARSIESTEIYSTAPTCSVLLVGGGGRGVLLAFVVFVKAASLQALALSHGGCLRQCLQESLEGRVVEVQRRLREPTIAKVGRHRTNGKAMR